MSGLKKRLKDILKEGPGEKKGELRLTTTDGSIFEISLPMDKDLRKSAVYVRMEERKGKYFCATYTTDEDVRPKTAFYESNESKALKEISALDLEDYVKDLVHGRT